MRPDKVKLPKEKRKCLSCDKSFMSEGVHNRICPSCKGAKNFTDLGMATSEGWRKESRDT